jgi:hypothetical protein
VLGELDRGFYCADPYSVCPKGGRAPGLRRAREGIPALLTELDLCQSGLLDDPLPLCFQQSPSNSTGPEVDVLFR